MSAGRQRIPALAAVRRSCGALPARPCTRCARLRAIPGLLLRSVHRGCAWVDDHAIHQVIATRWSAVGQRLRLRPTPRRIACSGSGSCPTPHSLRSLFLVDPNVVEADIARRLIAEPGLREAARQNRLTASPSAGENSPQGLSLEIRSRVGCACPRQSAPHQGIASPALAALDGLQRLRQQQSVYLCRSGWAGIGMHGEPSVLSGTDTGRRFTIAVRRSRKRTRWAHDASSFHDACRRRCFRI
jgi:hypothetical protein